MSDDYRFGEAGQSGRAPDWSDKTEDERRQERSAREKQSAGNGGCMLSLLLLLSCLIALVL